MMAGAFKLGKDLFGVAGDVSRSAELKNTRGGNVLCSFSVFAGKREDGSKIYISCKAWGPLAGYCSDLQKGDPVFCVGRTEQREYDGKTYTDLILDWCNSPMLATAAEAPPLPAASTASSEALSVEFEEVDDEDSGELPF